MRYLMPKTLALATGLGLLALLAPGRAEAIVIIGGLVGVVFDQGQAVQVNIANIDPNQAPCDVLVEFFDVAGGLLKSTRLSVPATQSRAACSR
jgi:hypothetical protein